jgi:hypothetical protein
MFVFVMGACTLISLWTDKIDFEIEYKIDLFSDYSRFLIYLFFVFVFVFLC